MSKINFDVDSKKSKISYDVSENSEPDINYVVKKTSSSLDYTSGGDAYYTGLAKDWAIKMSGKILGEDYSSKYYAGQAKQSLETAEGLIEGFADTVEQATGSAVNTLDTEKDNLSLELIELKDNLETDLNTIKAQAQSAADAAETSEDNAQVWSEGTDEEVQALGGIHSAKGWASAGQVGAVWGNINGRLSDQTDLQNALDDKQDTISDLDTYLQNTATNTDTYSGSLTILGNSSGANDTNCINIGVGSSIHNIYDDYEVSARDCVAIGNNSEAGPYDCMALGDSSHAEGQACIQLGAGRNTTNQTLQVYDYTLLNLQTGKIPDDRISANIADTVKDQNTDTRLKFWTGRKFAFWYEWTSPNEGIEYEIVYTESDTPSTGDNVYYYTSPTTYAIAGTIGEKFTYDSTTEELTGPETVYSQATPALTPDSNTIYNIIDSGEIYKGSVLIANNGADKVSKSGDTMTGALDMNGNINMQTGGSRLNFYNPNYTDSYAAVCTNMAGGTFFVGNVDPSGWAAGMEINQSANTIGLTKATTIRGNATINGTTNINGFIYESNTTNSRMVQKATSLTKGTAPSSQILYGLLFEDKNGNNTAANRIGAIDCTVETDNKVFTAIRTYQQNSGTTTNANIGIGYNSSKAMYTYAPACQENNSIVTTVAKSKGSNGYYKLGNGLIIQWGMISGVARGSTVTFPTAFSSSTSYKVVCDTHYSAASGGYVTWVYDLTATEFKFGAGSGTVYAQWLAIGY